MAIYMNKPAPTDLRAAIYMRSAIYMNTGSQSFSIPEVQFSVAQRTLTPDEVKQLAPGAQIVIHIDGSGSTVLPPIVQKVYSVVALRQSFEMSLLSPTGISLPGGSFAPEAIIQAFNRAGQVEHKITLRKIR